MKVGIETIAKYAGFATVAIEWSALLIYYFKMPLYFGGEHPISHYATLPETKYVFTACYVLAAFCFWIFVRYHLTKYYQVPLKIFGVSLLLFAGVGLFPYSPSDVISSVIHSALALASCVLFLVGMYILIRRSSDKRLLSVTGFSIVMSFSLAMLFLSSIAGGRFNFMFEAGAWFILQVWTIWISVYVYKLPQKIEAKNNTGQLDTVGDI